MRSFAPLAVVGLLLLSGCASQYRDVAATAPSAIVEFEKGYTTGLSAAATGASQEYLIAPVSEDRECQSLSRAAFFAWMNSDPVMRRVEAGVPLRIYAWTRFSRATGVTGAGDGFTVQRGHNFCLAEALFTPEAGHTYRIAQREHRVGVCALEVVDVSTAAAPEGLTLRNDTGCYGGRRVES